MESTSDSRANSKATETPVPEGKSPVDAVKAGARDARAAAAKLNFSLSRGVYRVAYAASYGVVYGALALTSWIPARSPVAEGVRDGASAAALDFKANKDAEASASVSPVQAEAGLATA